METSTPLEIVIVGGGTAGWMVGTALVSGLRPHQARVRLVESDEIATVGVGEATIPAMRDYNRFVGIDEVEMMRETNGTFKLGIEFLDWGFKGSSYHHPFGVHGAGIGGAGFHHHWNRARLAGHDFDIEQFSYAIAAARADRFEFPNPDPDKIDSTYSYAYHFDASLYAKYLRKVAEGRGLKRTEGKVVEVTRDPLSGDVASITLASGEVIKGDFFVDCTGFRGLLIGQTLNSPFEDWTGWLPCDRAWAVPCARAGRFTPFTRSTAREAGWQWRIPLQHRTGNGHVFCSEFLSDDEATRILLDQVEGDVVAGPMVVPFKTGVREKIWHKNVLSLGLASGFIEPLESTAIHLVYRGMDFFFRYLPDRNCDPRLASEYNRRMAADYTEIRDFIVLHYCATARDDTPFWRKCRDMTLPDSLRARIELFRANGTLREGLDELFRSVSWHSVLEGMGIHPVTYHPLVDRIDEAWLYDAMDKVRAQLRQVVATLPTHQEFIDAHCRADAVNLSKTAR